jgi:hypothetical protein
MRRTPPVEIRQPPVAMPWSAESGKFEQRVWFAEGDALQAKIFE